MLDRLDRPWRVVATGLCFALFGVSSLLLGVVVLPLVRLAVHDRARQEQLARGLIRTMFRLLVGVMRATGVLSFEVSGLERLRGGGRLILANHPTLIDAVLLLSLVDRGDCVIKSALRSHPITGATVRAAGFVFNDEGGEELVHHCVRSVRAGSNLIIFPEGTRSSPGVPLRLQRGAARVALHGEVDITPVRIRCMPATLAKGARWWAVPPRRAHIRIDIDEPIAVSPFIAGSPNRALAARHLTEHLTAYFSRGHELASA